MICGKIAAPTRTQRIMLVGPIFGVLELGLGLCGLPAVDILD